jgi:hypothetical protein
MVPLKKSKFFNIKLYRVSNTDYFPTNIMFDRRVARGSTYAAMVIPAGTNPDAMMMDKKQEEKKRKSNKKVLIFN